MKLVGHASRPGRGEGKKAADDLGSPLAGPHIDRAVLPVRPQRVRPDVDRFAAQLDLILARGVAVDRVSRRLARVDLEEPFPLGPGGLLASAGVDPWRPRDWPGTAASAR